MAFDDEHDDNDERYGGCKLIRYTQAEGKRDCEFIVIMRSSKYSCYYAVHQS